MNQAHLHLILNHAPVFGSLFGLLTLAFGLWRKQDLLIQTGFLVLLLAAGASMATELTGSGASKIVKAVNNADGALIKEHAGAGRLANWVLVGTAALGLVAWLTLLNGRLQPWLGRLTLLGAAVSFGLMARAANLGGHITHPETRPGFEAPTQ